MKRLILIALMMSFFNPVSAKVMKGSAIDYISTKNPREIISVKLSRDFDLNDSVTLRKGYVLVGKMQDINHPTSWHHNAYFTFVPMSYIDLEHKEHLIKDEIKAVYRQKMKPDYKHSEITVGEFMFSPSYIDNTKRMLNGETKDVWNEYANRNTPWGMGEEIEIKSGETIYFNFPD